MDEHRQTQGILAFVVDTTTKVQAHLATEASERQLRLLTDALPVLIGYLDREERYRFANRAYEPWFNQKPEDLLGRAVREVVGAPSYAVVKPYIDRALAGERVDFEAQMPYREHFTRFMKTSYVPDMQDGTVMGFYTLVTDITEQVHARELVERLNAELALANEELEGKNRR